MTADGLKGPLGRRVHGLVFRPARLPGWRRAGYGDRGGAAAPSGPSGPGGGLVVRRRGRFPGIRLLLPRRATTAGGTFSGGFFLPPTAPAWGGGPRRGAPRRYVTKAMREVEFHEPVFL